MTPTQARQAQFISDKEHCFAKVAGQQVNEGDYVILDVFRQGKIRGIYRQSYRDLAGRRFCFDVKGHGIQWFDEDDLFECTIEQKAKWTCMGDDLRNWKAPWGSW